MMLMKQKTFCRDCGWYVVLAHGCIRFLPADVDKCPKCGGQDLRAVFPTVLESVNPIESVRGLGFELLRLLGMSSHR
jgi:hypothetical protein